MTDNDDARKKDEGTIIPPGSAALLAAAIAQDRTKDDPVASSRAELFLDEQTKLIKLQTAQLDEQRRLLLASLRFRHAGELMSVTLQVMLGLVGLAVVIALGASIWAATHDYGLVIETFDVPPDLAARGLTGKVVASQLLDRLSELQDDTDSSRAADTYKNNWGDDVKVEIPDTGISIGELNRYLREWLGHETHIGGEVFHTATGIAVTARTSGSPGLTFDGPESDLGTLLQKAAEDTYARTQPYRYSVYLDNHRRRADGDRILQQLLAHGPAAELKWAHVGLANSANSSGDFETASNQAHAALAGNEDFSLPYFALTLAESARGHDEQALAALKKGVAVFAKKPNADLTQRAGDMLGEALRARLSEEVGDFSGAAHDNEIASTLPDYGGHARQAAIGRVVDLAFAHDIAGSDAARKSLGDAQAGDLIPLGRAAPIQFIAKGRWIDAAEAAQSEYDDLRVYLDPKTPGYTPQIAHFIEAFMICEQQPWAAFAAAEAGSTKNALALIGVTFRDCYAGLRMRGKIDALAGKWDAAAYWFDAATKDAPSIPFAYADWGEMLLAKGDLDGAMAKFAIATVKGPNFADPLEMWGEALMRKNRSDRAMAKFGQANQYSPNWGRLHLKWGEALYYVGEKAEARKQFAIAGGLYLTPAEKSELGRAGS